MPFSAEPKSLSGTLRRRLKILNPCFWAASAMELRATVSDSSFPAGVSVFDDLVRLIHVTNLDWPWDFSECLDFQFFMKRLLSLNMLSRLNARQYVANTNTTTRTTNKTLPASSGTIPWPMEKSAFQRQLRSPLKADGEISLTVMKPSGRYAIVMYVSIRMLFPCLIAMWLSCTFVTAESCRYFRQYRYLSAVRL